ncbi:MAG: hypothetical protein QXH80_04585 [Candidatus Nanoarchaeia archaeon]
MFKKLFVFLACLGTIFCAHAQVVVSKFAEGRNPTIYCNGISGNQEFSSRFVSNLKNCGWFDISSTPSADYVADGTASGSTATINLRDGAGNPKLSFSVPLSGTPTKNADSAVDYLLKKIFNVEICSSKIAFSVETGTGIKEIYYCDFDGSNIVRATNNKTLSVEADWYPGKSSIIYTMYSKMSTDIVEYDTLTRRSRRLCQFPGLNSCAAISPNGKFMAIILSRDNQVELYIKEVETRAMRRLTTSKSVEASPCWSPDGTRICYVSDASGRPALYIIPAGGGASTRLPTVGSEAATPAWSKDNKIAYSAKMGRNYAIAVLDLSGKTQSGLVVDAAGDWENPSWAPDNRHVVCSRSYGGKSTLFVIDTQTKKMRQLINSNFNMSFPAWSGLFK